jgi:hypothetical protein
MQVTVLLPSLLLLQAQNPSAHAPLQDSLFGIHFSSQIQFFFGHSRGHVGWQNSWWETVLSSFSFVGQTNPSLVGFQIQVFEILLDSGNKQVSFVCVKQSSTFGNKQNQLNFTFQTSLFINCFPYFRGTIGKMGDLNKGFL